MPVTPRNTNIEWQDTVFIPDPGAAGVDHANVEVWKAPFSCEVTDVTIRLHAASAGVDNANTAVVAVKKNNTGAAVVSKTYNATVVPPAAGVLESLGAITAATRLFNRNDEVTIDVTNGATANWPDMSLTIRYKARRS